MARLLTPTLRPRVEPRRVHDWEDSRRATWLELFYDLVFVVVVSRLATLLHADHDLTGVLTYVGLFVPVWWAWISFSYYADLFDEDRTLDRLVQLGATLGAAVVAVSLTDGVGDDARLYAGAFAAMFLVLTALYVHAAWTAPAARELCRWYVAGSASGAALWLASLAVPAPGRYWLWGAAVLVNALLSGPIAYARVASPPHQVSHMPERFGLFALVVLGESVLGVVNGVEATDWRAASVVTAVAGFVIAASIWWVYFGAFDEAAIDRAIAEGRHAQVRSFVYGYGHIAVYAAVAATGVGVRLSIESAANGEAPVGLLAVALTGVMLGLTLMASGIGTQGPHRIVVAKAATVVVGILAAVLLSNVAVATSITAVAWAVLAAVKTSVVRAGSYDLPAGEPAPN
jgi:low temperature requirement protein LtrA